jgi:hypothetical protein
LFFHLVKLGGVGGLALAAAAAHAGVPVPREVIEWHATEKHG